MLEAPNNDSAINEEAANLYKNDRKKFDATAKEWTRKYAK